MEHSYQLTKPELFTLQMGNERYRGADQEWYPDEWQRKAGCGPTCAAILLRYLACTRRAFRELCPNKHADQSAFLSLMQSVWIHITPSRMGVNTLYLFTQGLKTYAEEHGIVLQVRELDIPSLRIARPTIDQCVAFLRTAMNADSPVAFLNLSSGEVPDLDSWHWVTIIGFEERSDGTLPCTILDCGKEFSIDFRLWFQTSRLGGGLVYVPAL